MRANNARKKTPWRLRRQGVCSRNLARGRLPAEPEGNRQHGGANRRGVNVVIFRFREELRITVARDAELNSAPGVQASAVLGKRAEHGVNRDRDREKCAKEGVESSYYLNAWFSEFHRSAIVSATAEIGRASCRERV